MARQDDDRLQVPQRARLSDRAQTVRRHDRLDGEPYRVLGSQDTGHDRQDSLRRLPCHHGAGIAERESRSAAEGGCVKPLGQPVLGAAFELGAFAVVDRTVGARKHTGCAGVKGENRSSTLPREKTRRFPTREHTPQRAVRPLPRQLHSVADDNPMRRVKHVERAVQLEIVEIHAAPWRDSTLLVEENCSVGVVNELAEGVSQTQQRGAEPLCDLHLQRVIDGAADILRAEVYVLKLRKRTQQLRLAQRRRREAAGFHITQ